MDVIRIEIRSTCTASSFGPAVVPRSAGRVYFILWLFKSSTMLVTIDLMCVSFSLQTISKSEYQISFFKVVDLDIAKVNEPSQHGFIFNCEILS